MSSSNLSRTLEVETVEEFEQLLGWLTGLGQAMSGEVVEALREFIASSGPSPARSLDDVSRDFYARMNDKMRLNAEKLAAVHKQVADLRLALNYHQRKRVAWSVNRADRRELSSALVHIGVPIDVAESMASSCAMTSHVDARDAIKHEAMAPTKLRKLPDRDVAIDVKSSAAGALVAALWPDEARYRAVGASGAGDDAADYMSFLQNQAPELFNRDRALSVRFVSAAEAEVAGQVRSGFETWLREEYEALTNHGFLAVILEVPESGKPWAWDAALDLTVVAERLIESEVSQMFFRWRDVERETVSHIGESIDRGRSAFSTMNEGFTYRDTFVLVGDEGRLRRLVVTFQKNARDETVIPCPACRSSRVEGNSYPSLGVKSWACANPICPARSIYNRGKRYQFKSILQQAAIEDPGNQIAVSSVRRWQRDVVAFVDDLEIVETLIAHYSMRGDGVRLVNFEATSLPVDMGRRISLTSAEASHATTPFWDSCFFARYLPATGSVACEPNDAVEESDRFGALVEGDAEVSVGDSLKVLNQHPEHSVDLAITSPPYFNAREYAQWPNLYTYMHDMIMNAREVYRVLKPGSLYVYNIFDYFDNERTVVFSDMGRKRIPLASLIADGFRRVGFELAGVTVWDKGEIHGKRGFNGGNFSPFYQSPFNCWEHVLVFRKPEDASGGVPDSTDESALTTVLKLHPVVKMVRGKNVLGHTAPFPLGLPAHFIRDLDARSVVLDPYAGSGTTGISALQHGMRALLIERDPSYAQLIRRRLLESRDGLFPFQNDDELSMV